jgi:RNA polymerase sigma-70 factor (ECF subfamily)
MKTLTSRTGVQGRHEHSTSLRDALWEWVARPTHYPAVRKLRIIAHEQDQPALIAMLHPDVAVAVTSTRGGVEKTVVARGARDAAPVLLHGFNGGPGVVVAERAVDGQAGLVMTNGDEVTAMITVDFTGRLVSLVWVRLHPDHLRHGNAYWLAD